MRRSGPNHAESKDTVHAHNQNGRPRLGERDVSAPSTRAAAASQQQGGGGRGVGDLLSP